MSVCPVCEAPAVHSEASGWVHLPDQDARLSTLARLEVDTRMKGMEEQARKALDLVREAGDCCLLHRSDAAMDRISKASLILRKIGRGDAT